MSIGELTPLLSDLVNATAGAPVHIFVAHREKSSCGDPTKPPDLRASNAYHRFTCDWIRTALAPCIRPHLLRPRSRGLLTGTLSCAEPESVGGPHSADNDTAQRVGPSSFRSLT